MFLSKKNDSLVAFYFIIWYISANFLNLFVLLSLRYAIHAKQAFSNEIVPRYQPVSVDNGQNSYCSYTYWLDPAELIELSERRIESYDSCVRVFALYRIRTNFFAHLHEL